MNDRDDKDYPPLNLKTDEEIIEYIDEHQVRGLHSQGYEWLWSVYMPALARVVDADLVDDETIAGNFYAIGDVHDFNESPRTAITYYKRALDYDPELNAAHREIARMYHRLGFIDAAIHHSDLALAIWPDEKSAVADRIDIDEDKNSNDPWYEKNDTPAALARDALARQEPVCAVKLLEGLDDVESIRILTWAHGANHDLPAYLSNWETFARKVRETPSSETTSLLSKNELYIGWGDYFYMPDKIWYGSEIWKIWMESGLTLSGLSTKYEGLDDREADSPIDDKFAELSWDDQYAQKIEYRFYERTTNLEALKVIQSKYPNWKELNATIVFIETMRS